LQTPDQIADPVLSSKSSKRRRAVGAFLIVAAIIANPAILYTALDRKIPFSPETIQNIVIVEAGLIAAGLFSLFPRSFLAAWRRTGANTAAQWLADPARSRHFWLSLIPFFLASLLRQSPLWEQTPYTWKQVLLASIMVESALSSALLKTGLIALLVKFVRRAWVAWLAALLLALIDFLDWAYIHYGSMRLSIASLFSAGQGALAYTNSRSAVTLLLFVAAAVYAVITLQHLQQREEHVFGKRRMAWFAIIFIISPTLLMQRFVMAPMPAVDRAIAADYLREIQPMSLPPLLNLSFAFLGNLGPKATAGYTTEDARLLAGYRSSGTNPPALPGGPFRRIILVTMESLSLNLMSRHNPAFSGSLTPVLDGLAPSAVNLRSVAQPTQYGLATHLCSHPSGEGLVEIEHPNALPSYLAKNGWGTAFYQSAPLDFQRGDKRFRELGYQVRFGREEAARQPALQPHIGEWGLRDRYVYSEAVKYLDKNRDHPLFLHILTADTHGPSGRLDYGAQAYPPTPAWISKYRTAHLYLQSWFRADFDFGEFLAELKTKGLLDQDTAIIVTGDHSCPINPIYRTIPRIDREIIDRIPWILLTSRPLQLAQPDRLSGQVDTAPTIAHLAGLAPLPGWWGQSLLAHLPARNQIAWRGQQAYVVTSNQVTELAPPDLKEAASKIEVR
jgi:hypothetical protein